MIGGAPRLAAIAVVLSSASAVPCPGGVVALVDLDSGLPSPSGTYRWLDVADQAYGTNYQEIYNYTQADVEIHFTDADTVLRGVLDANGLKPNFTYQFKLVGEPGTAANERVGFTGRWWQEQDGGPESERQGGWNIPESQRSCLPGAAGHRRSHQPHRSQVSIHRVSRLCLLTDRRGRRCHRTL